MNINDLAPARGAKKSVKRVGRGIGSGMGKTSTRGHKGQWARSGGGVRIGFEGGQMPMTRRMPKVGFNNHFKKEYNVINVGLLQNSEAIADGSVVTRSIGRSRLGKQSLRLWLESFGQRRTYKEVDCKGCQVLRRSKGCY